MDHLLAWQNVIFYIPLAVGLLLIVGSAMGGHHGGADHDVGHDLALHGDGGGAGALDAAHGHGDGDGHEGGLLTRALSMLGVGRVPLTVVLMMASLLFGGIGIITNTILSSLGLPAWIHGLCALAVAFVGMVSLTSSAARLLNRFFPTTETYRVSRHDFAGCTGMLLLPADPQSGYAQVKDHEGNVHNIKCRTSKGALPKGGEILVIEYDERTATYLVDVNPGSEKPAV